MKILRKFGINKENRFRRDERVTPALTLEGLEPRVLLSVLPPNPIDPDNGEFNHLEHANIFPTKDQFNALDNYPIPYVIVAQAGDNDPVIVNWKAGNAYTKVNVDNSKATGNGGSGNDIQVRIATELLPSPHLVMDIERLGDAPFVEDITVLVAFPFDAFNSEMTLPGSPNLFMGYKSLAPGGTDGGHAPGYETIQFIPGILGGTDHTFEMVFTTTGDDNPQEYIVGHFDGDNIAGILNASAIAAQVETADHTVPDTISVGLDVSSSFPLGSPLSGSVGLVWDASETADVLFSYQENELGDEAPIDYSTFVWVSPMPTHEELSFSISENPGFTLSHRGSSVIDDLVLQHQREDGLLIFATATDIPTEVDLFIDVDGTQIQLDVNANTMDLQIELIKDGGFINTEDVLGFDVGYLLVEAQDVPDLTAGFDPVLNQFTISATNAGESIPLLGAIVDDDAAYNNDMTAVVGLELPPSWNDTPAHHILSFVEDGTHGTAAARLVHVKSATLTFGASDISEAYHIITAQAAPMQFYLKFSEDSNFIPGDPNKDIEVTGDIDNIPAGEINWDYEAPYDFHYMIDPPQGIDSVHFYGHIGSANFDFLAGDLPPEFDFHFDPDGEMTVLAEDGFGGPDTVGFAALRFWDNEGNGLPGSGGLLGEPLNDARARVDDMPSFHATWSIDGTGTDINFNTDGNNVFLGGAQFMVSTLANLLTPLAEASSSSDHYALLNQEDDPDGYLQLGAGAFGIDEFDLETSGSIDLHYDADSARELVVTINRSFGGPFFPAGYNFDVDVVLTVDEVPQLFDFFSDLMTGFDYTASSGIDAITLAGTVDDTNDSTDNGTDILFFLGGLPSQVNVDVDPSDHARLTMNSALDLILLSLSSDNDIFGSGYRQIEASITNIPAKFDATWGGNGFLVETKNAADNPAPLGTLSAMVSTSNDDATNAGKVEPFTLDGPIGPVGTVLDGSDGTRVGYSLFQQEIDSRYYTSSGATSVLSRLSEIYAGSEQLDNGEDHVIARMEGGSIDYASFQYTGFQHVSWTPDANGGQFIFRNPTPGLHPLFAGYEDGDFTTMQIANIPDEIVVDVDLTGAITYNAADDVDPSIQQIDIYKGPLPVAGDGDNALRVIMNDVPASASLTWDFSFSDGGIFFDADREFELLFLNQNGSSRIVAGLQLQDLSVQWGYGFTLSLDYDFPIFADLRISRGVCDSYSKCRRGSLLLSAFGVTLSHVPHVPSICSPRAPP